MLYCSVAQKVLIIVYYGILFGIICHILAKMMSLLHKLMDFPPLCLLLVLIWDQSITRNQCRAVTSRKSIANGFDNNQLSESFWVIILF